jgi:hypothetical protein
MGPGYLPPECLTPTQVAIPRGRDTGRAGDLVVVQWEATPQFTGKTRFVTFLSQISKPTNICPGLAVLRQLTNHMITVFLSE